MKPRRTHGVFDGLVSARCDAAAMACFGALNAMAAYLDDPEAARVVHVTEWVPPATEGTPCD